MRDVRKGDARPNPPQSECDDDGPGSSRALPFKGEP